MDTVQLIEQFDQRRSPSRGSRFVLPVVAGVLAVVGVGVLAVTALPALLSSEPDGAAPSAGVEPVIAAASGSELLSSSTPTSAPEPPPPGSSRSRVSQFLAARDPGGPVPVHPELQLSDYTVKVMVRNDLEEAQQGARIVANTLVDGERPKVQIIRRPRNGRIEHWVLVGRFKTRTGAMRAKASLRPILNQGANHLQLSDACAELGPVIDGLRDCTPLP